MSNFKSFARALAAQFDFMSVDGLLVRVDVDRDALWDAYLAAFPEGTNPIYRVRTEHDGSYDRNFVKKLGGVISIKDGVWTSIWDAEELEYPYNVVAKKLAKFVRKNTRIVSAFRHNEQRVGYVSTTERLENGQIKTWNHFHAAINSTYYSREIDTVLGDINTTVQMAQRALLELTPPAVNQVLELIDANTLYRGAEFRAAVAAFQQFQRSYYQRPPARRDTFLWENQNNQVGRIRNTAIGTLLTDLSDGLPLEQAVAAFEAKVAPTNYKRPTALVTPGMVNEAMKTIEALHLEPSLERRFAVLADVSVNDVLWVDGSVRDIMRDGGLREMLETAAAPKAKTKDAEKISIEDFIAGVLPKATGVEVLFKNAHQSHLVSITAPVHADAVPLFKWGNPFAWSYKGNITDSIKERVKAAGGNVDAKLRVSLAWFNYDDLDIHAFCPDGHVYFGSKGGDRNGYGRGQLLDVDMNAGSGETRTPVENLSWVSPKNGVYQIKVNQYSRRETSDVGFTLEFAYDGRVEQFSYDKAVKVGETVNSLMFEIVDGQLKSLDTSSKDFKREGMSQVVWGVETEKFVKVNTIMFSPNYWGEDRTGNKHVFFLLDKCVNDEPTRGVYNEFLADGLEKHRKVFELVGDKTKCAPTDEQLSGLGFSSTRKDSVTVKVTGPKINQTYTIHF